MINILNFPRGYKLSETELSGTIGDDTFGNAAMFLSFTHGLSNGDVVYIQSNVEAYNGFKVIQVANPSAFLISDNVDAFDNILFIQNSDATYQVSVLTHGVLAANNPIVYEFESTLFPENTEEESYVPAVVASQANENGYTKLILSGNISDNTPLSWIQVGGEKYQIISAISDSIVVINLAYDAANTFTGPVTKYYNNYCINVNVYCGYDSAHKWYAEKPYELAATLKFTPDANNQIKFSIAEIVRSYLITRNKLDLDTLPNNIDFSTGFYVEYWESYDESDGVEITTFTGDIITDIFQGLAINAEMPFKSKHISHMSDYISEGSDLAQWFTLQESVTWIVGKFMDLSFLKAPADIALELQINGEVQAGVLDDTGTGVIRVPLTFDTAGEYCVQVFKAAVAPRAGSGIILAAMVNSCGVGWTLGGTPSITVACCGTETPVYLTELFASDAGVDHTFTLDVTIGAGAGVPLSKIRVVLLDDDCNLLAYADTSFTSAGAKSMTVVLNPTSNGTKVGVWIKNNTLIYNKDYTVTGFSFDGSPGLPASEYTEQFCITVVDECDSTFIPTGDLRLLEDGSYRLLE